MKRTLDSYIRLAKALVDLFYPLLEVSIFEGKKEIGVFNRFDQDVRRQGRQSRVELGQYALCFIYDTSLFSKLQNVLGQLTGDREQVIRLPLEEEVQTYLQSHRLTVEGASRTEKRALVQHLYEQGLFNYKEAAGEIAHLLGLSRATIYNYLKWATLMAGINVHQVDTFTEERFEGNPAGVVLDAEHLDDGMMRKITRELNLSETAFVLPSLKGDFRLRYFTPTGDEVDFCGHSTVGALYMLAHDRRLGVDQPGHYSFSVETNVGLLDMEIFVESEETITVRFQTPKVQLVKTAYSYQQICEALGIDLADVRTDLPILLEKTNRDLFIPLSSLEKLRQTQIDLKSAEHFARKEGIVAFALLVPEALDPKNDAHIRCFAPAVGITEDPFTGSVLGGLAHYLFNNRLVDSRKKQLTIEQGHFINRPGTVKLEMEEKQVMAEAKAIHLFSTKMRLH